MKKIIILLIAFSLGDFNINLQSVLDWSDGKIIDKKLNDSEALFPIKNFIVNIEENESLIIEASIVSKTFMSNQEVEELSSILDQSFKGYEKKNIEATGGEGLTYFVSKPMFMRGVRLIQVSVLPFQYDTSVKEYVLYNNINLNVNILKNSNQRNQNNIPLSDEFNTLISSFVDNYEPREITENIPPSILFICGGNSATHSSMQSLIDWRKQMGYEVHVAEVSDIGNSTTAIKNYIQSSYVNWNNPPEYVVLVGDTDGSFSIPYFSTTWGASDYDYTLLEGDDLFPEMFIGRISANGSSDLDNIINKTIAYEKATYLNFTGTDWYERAALNADPSSSGNSTIITNEYIEEILETNGFEDINTNYGDGNYANWMQNELSEGILYMNYRGYIGTSGFGAGQINNANNGYMNPFATFITCSTGDFNYTCLSEDFIRAGSATNPKGAVAAIGTATSSTHTAPNNILQMGIYDGIFSKGLTTAGSALVSGKVTLFNNYIANSVGTVDNFTHWNNLMGDPVLNLWTDTPRQIQVSHPQYVYMGSTYLEVNVQSESGEVIENAWVSLTKEEWGDSSISAYTNDEGLALFEINILDDSDIVLTITGKNIVPYQESILISNNSQTTLVNYYIEDFNSNLSDGYINSFEQVEIYFTLESNIQLSESNYVATLDLLSSNGALENSQINFNMLSTNTIGPFLFTSEYLVESEDIKFHLNISDEWSNWDYLVSFNAKSADISLSSMIWGGEGVYPGSSADLSMSLINLGSMEFESGDVSLLSSSSLVNIENPTSNAGQILPQEISEMPLFNIEFSNDIINGSSIDFVLLVANETFYQEINFSVIVGEATVHDPLGPDAYGYYIYDSQDYGYGLMPTYDWIEIAPSEGGDGYDLQISDNGNGNNINNSTKYVQLPFDFTFYGVSYDEISVSSNGWISFGHTSMESFRNYAMPGAGGPSPMVAAFWDDLVTSPGEVYALVEDDHVIIEWYQMRTYDQNSDETFQIILYDSTTPTGDDEIKIQYKEVNNTSYANYYHPVYSTVGIENHLGNVGLEYTYDNTYPVTAMTLSDEMALFITTQNTNVYNLGDVNQDDSEDVLDIILIVNHILNIQNLSNLGEYLADTNQNSIINILDVIILINIILDN